MAPINVLAVSFSTARWWAAAITVAACLLAMVLVSASSPRRETPADRRTSLILRPFVGADGRLSTSHTVVLAWTGVVAYILVALIIANPPDWSDAMKNLSPTYLLLLGFPYASLVLAKATVTSRKAKGTLVKSSTDDPATLSQLFTDDDGNTDVFDVQYIVFNVIAMIFAIVQFSRATVGSGFPEIPDGIILLTGGPAAVYLTNKFMPNSGPAIFGPSQSQVRVGQSFTIAGQNLAAPGAAATPPQVTIGGVPASVSGFTQSNILVAAPDVGTDLGRQLDVAVRGPSGVQALKSAALTVLGRVPILHGASTGVAQVGEKVILWGDWTDKEAARLIVQVDTGVVASTSDPSQGVITFVVPPLAKLGEPRQLPVWVKLGLEASDPITLVVSPPNGVPLHDQATAPVHVTGAPS